MDYTYRLGRVERVTDGDTFWVHLDVGFRTTVLAHCRLNAADCPELRGTDPVERAAGQEARDYVAEFLAWPCTVTTHKDPDSFGRWLVDVRRDAGPDLATALTAAGLATYWPTRWRDVYL